MLLIWTVTCVLIMSAHTANAASLVCYNESIADSMELPLKEISKFINTKYLPIHCQLILLIHGYSTQINKYILQIITNLITKFGGTKCYCALNWEKEAAANIGLVTKPIEDTLGLEAVGFDYSAASAAAGELAKATANEFKYMDGLGFNVSALYIIGHSEGAHLAGNIGKHLKELGILIARIDGLDPAKSPIEKSLSKEDAKLVSCLFTDHYFLGSDEDLCLINFWINYGCKVQPGCMKYTVPLTPDSLCSHLRAYSYAAEAILGPTSFQGRRADNYYEYTQSNDTPSQDNINFIGFDINPSIIGSFYACTNAEPPYRKGPKGMKPSLCTCPTT